MEELFYSIIGLLVQVGIAAIIIYALVWYLYKHIVKPDVDKINNIISAIQKIHWNCNIRGLYCNMILYTYLFRKHRF